MKIAIVGAGMAGLAAAWPLLQKESVAVTLFDPKGVGQGTSGIGSGLLYPFPGRLALRSWRAQEGIEATHALLYVAEEILGCPVAKRTGILRIAATEQQKRDFFARSQKDPDAEWWEEEKVRAAFPRAIAAPALWIPSGSTVFTQRYLEGLWLACEKRGASLEKQKISDLRELDSFDRVILATGFEVFQWKEYSHLPLKATKGQVLLCRSQEILPFSLSSHGQIALSETPMLYQIGATYENDLASLESKGEELIQKVALFYPPARHWDPVEIRSGVRISPQNGYRPLIAEVAPKIWVFSGLGSRGLLYHALLGRTLASSILESEA